MARKLTEYCPSLRRNMAFRRAAELPLSETKQRVYFAARDGMAITIYALLCNRVPAQQQAILSSVTEDQGQKATPFVIAARNGHEKVCRMLLTQFRVDVEQTGIVRFDGFTIEGATGLWCAAAAGHYEVAKTLVNFGANVNHATLSNSTPLRAACFDGRLDIVKYLLQHGADLSIANKYNNTCLMIAAYRGHTQVVAHLLEMGADPDATAHCGATALHFAAECGHCDIVKELLSCNAKMLRNDHGMSPLHISAECAQADVVEYFINHPSCNQKDRVEALELLGASYANDKDHYNLERTFNYFWLAMHERYIDKDNILPKEVHPALEAYGNQVECCNAAQLQAIKDNPDALHMEALIVRERILGADNPEIPQPIIFRGAVFADSLQFTECTRLWMRAMDLRLSGNRTITKDLLRFAQVFSQMLHFGLKVDFCVLSKVLKSAIQEISFNLRKTKEGSSEEKTMYTDILDCNIHTLLYLLVIATKVEYSTADELDLHKTVYKIVRMNLRLGNIKYTLLHAVLDEKVEVDDFHVADVVSFPNAAVAKLLIKCGANVNCYDEEGNTPLHIIMRYNKPISDFLTLHSIIMTLLENGVHTDVTNKKGLTPMDISTTGVAEIILRTQTRPSLKCLAAKTVKKNNIPYNGQVPVILEDFIKLH